MNLMSLQEVTRLAIASDPATNTVTLGQLAYDEEAIVRIAVAQHSNTSPLHLSKLASDCDCSVVIAVAENPHTPGDILAILANEKRDLFTNDAADAYWLVMASVAQNPNTPRVALNSFWRGEWEHGAIGRGRGDALHLDRITFRQNIVTEMRCAFRANLQTTK